MHGPTAQDAAKRLAILYYVIAHAMSAPPSFVLNQFLATASEDQKQTLQQMTSQRHEMLCSVLASRELWQFATPKEKAFLETPPLQLTDQQKLDGAWRKESAVTLMWALGMLDSFPAFYVESNDNLFERFPRQEIPLFIENARLISRKLLEEQRKLAELWHWRSRTRQLIAEQRPFPTEIPDFKSYDEIVRFSAKAANQKDGLEIIDEDFAVKGKAYRDLTELEWFQVRSITVERHYTLNWLSGHAPENDWDQTPTET